MNLLYDYHAAHLGNQYKFYGKMRKLNNEGEKSNSALYFVIMI